jgi:hypothetical protein
VIGSINAVDAKPRDVAKENGIENHATLSMFEAKNIN